MPVASAPSRPWWDSSNRFAAFVIHHIGNVAQARGGFGAAFPLLGGFLVLAFLTALFFYRERHFPLLAHKR